MSKDFERYWIKVRHKLYFISKAKGDELEIMLKLMLSNAWKAGQKSGRNLE